MKRSYPRLPNGMGHIKYIGPGRANPYAVLPPEYKDTEQPYAYKRALCYVPDWYTAFAVLMSYKAGTYKPGDEIEISRSLRGVNNWDVNDFARRVIADYQIIGAKKEDLANAEKHKFSDAFEAFMEQRFGEYATAKYAPRTVKRVKDSYKRLEPLYDRYIEDITLDELQAFVNDLSDKLARGTIQSILSICSSVFNYAMSREWVARPLPQLVKIPIKARDVKHMSAYTDEDLKRIMGAARAGHKTAIEIIEQTYTGFRISAMYDLQLDLENLTAYGGVKTGKRLVPILPELVPFFAEQPKPPCGREQMVYKIKTLCRHLDIPEVYSTHSARHTFKRLCDKYDVHPVAARLLMGHSPGKDAHDGVYTHWELDDLRRELQKIVVICAD